jgi:hypothetical protein
MHMRFRRDYYQVLGVSRDASRTEIRRAFRRLARRYHPDVSTEPDAEERFKAVNEAYQVLGDPATRAAYDRFLALRERAEHRWPDRPPREASYEPVRPRPVQPTPPPAPPSDLATTPGFTLAIGVVNILMSGTMLYAGLVLLPENWMGVALCGLCFFFVAGVILIWEGGKALLRQSYLKSGVQGSAAGIGSLSVSEFVALALFAFGVPVLGASLATPSMAGPSLVLGLVLTGLGDAILLHDWPK